MRKLLLAGLGGFWCLCPFFAHAQEEAVQGAHLRLHLRNGFYLDGEISSQGKDAYRIKTAFGVYDVQKKDVVSVEKTSNKLIKLERITLKAGTYFEGRVIRETPSDLLLQTDFGTLTINKTDLKGEEAIPEKKPPEVKPTPKPTESDTQKPPEKGLQPPSKKPSPLQEKIDKILQQFPEATAQEQKALMSDLSSLGAEAVPLLIDKMELADEMSLLAISIGLVRIGSPRTVNLLIPKLSHENAQIRATAVMVLGEVSDSTVLVHLRRLLTDKSPLVQGNAIDALVKLSDLDSLEDIAKTMLSKDLVVRRKASAALVILIPKSESKGALLRTLGGILEDARREDILVEELIDLLGRLGIPDALPYLTPYIQHDNKGVRMATIVAIGKIGARDAVDDLVAWLPREQDQKVKIEIADTFRKLRNPKAIPTLIQMLREEDRKLQLTASDALTALTSEHFGLDVDGWENWWKIKTGNK